MRFLTIIWLALTLGTAMAEAASPVTSYTHMTEQLQADASRSPLIRLTSIGKSAHGKKDLWLARVTDPTQNSSQNFRLLVLCRQHGDEPASTEAVLSLIHRLASGGDPALRRSLSHVTLYIVPMVNPDGADANTRGSGVGADLNRDWGVFHQPETRAVANVAKRLHPNMVIDAHNWDVGDLYDADCLEIPREMQTPLGRTSHTLQQYAVHQLAADGYALHPTAWGPDTDSRLAHRWFARQGILSALVETHYGSPSDTADFQRRQGMYVALLHGLINHYAASYLAEKPRLDAMEGMANVSQDDAMLFAPSPPTHLTLAARTPYTFVWLWALGAFGLAVWGGKTRPGGTADKSGLTKRLPGRYALTRKRDGTETRVRSGQRRAVNIPSR